VVVLFGLAPRLWLAVAALVLGGGVNFVLSTFRNAITQTCVEDAVRGRIQGLFTVVLVGGPQVVNVLHGVAGAAFGARWAICAGGLLTAGTVASIIRAVPPLWRYAAPAAGPEPAMEDRPRAGTAQCPQGTVRTRLEAGGPTGA
jgi:hypothetical protein